MSSKKENMVILVNRAAQIGLPGDPGNEVAELAQGQVLDPGENDVDPQYWEKVKNHHAVKMLLAVKELEAKGLGKAKKLTEGLDALEKHEALKQIAKCDEIKILNDWADKTGNESLKDACKVKIKKIIDSQGTEES